jgi:hypothetical protein
MKLLRILVFSCSTIFNGDETGRFSGEICFSCTRTCANFTYVFITNLARKGCSLRKAVIKYLLASLKTSLYFQKYKRMGWAGIAQSV